MVRIDPLFLGEAPARPAGASVTFEPGARTAWHTHPLGQTLIITAGCGWVQRMGVPGRFLRLHLLVCAYRVIGATWIRRRILTGRRKCKSERGGLCFGDARAVQARVSG